MQSWNNDFDRRFRLMQRFVFGFIAVVFMLVIAGWILAGYLAFTAASEVKEQGLKAVVEQIWCGPNNKCLGK